MVTGVFGVWVRRALGGNTGDTLGAACELAEVVPVVVLACYSAALSAPA